MTRIRAAGASDVGSTRAVNEDAWTFLEDTDTALAIVADGLGGIASGEVAAELTLAACTTAFERRVTDYAEAWWKAEHDPIPIAWAELADADRAVIEDRVHEIRSTRSPATPGDLAILESEGDILAAVARRGLVAASQTIAERQAGDLVLRGMAATAVVAMFGRGVVSIAHVGDARCYLLRDGSLRQVTEDHTLLVMLLKSGELRPEEAEDFPHKSVITRGLGIGEVEVDTLVLETVPDDVFLLCSDGLTTTLDAERLREALEQRGCEAAAYLVDEARRTSRDNVTALVVEVTG